MGFFFYNEMSAVELFTITLSRRVTTQRTAGVIVHKEIVCHRLTSARRKRGSIPGPHLWG